MEPLRQPGYRVTFDDAGVEKTFLVQAADRKGAEQHVRENRGLSRAAKVKSVVSLSNSELVAKTLFPGEIRDVPPPD